MTSLDGVMSGVSVEDAVASSTAVAVAWGARSTLGDGCWIVLIVHILYHKMARSQSQRADGVSTLVETRIIAGPVRMRPIMSLLGTLWRGTSESGTGIRPVLLVGYPAATCRIG